MQKLDKIGHANVSYKSTSAILNKASAFLEGYDFTLNAYIGCSFKCRSYCYAINFVSDPGKRDSWGDWVEVKENAVNLISRKKPGSLDSKIIYMSSVTDPYQPIERTTELTRAIVIEIIKSHKPWLVVQTRSPLVTRDLDIYKQLIDNGGKVNINLSLTTDDDQTRRFFEPTCPGISARFKTIEKIVKSGVPASVTLSPLLPVTDVKSFGERLLNTGVDYFVSQPFHPKSSRIYAASTPNTIDNLLSVFYNSSVLAAWEKYTEQYHLTIQTLEEILPVLHYGKAGFQPPFNRAEL